MADFILQIDTRIGLPNNFFKEFCKTLVLALDTINKSALEIYSYSTCHICNQYCQKYISQRAAIKAGVPEIEL